jgi:hypothetical protein
MKVVQNIVQSGFTACAGRSQLQVNTTLPPPPTKAAIMTWDWKTTVEFLNERSFHSYAAHFQMEQLNGMALLAVDSDDINDMPEKHGLKRKAFALFLSTLQ